LAFVGQSSAVIDDRSARGCLLTPADPVLKNLGQIESCQHLLFAHPTAGCTKRLMTRLWANC